MRNVRSPTVHRKYISTKGLKKLVLLKDSSDALLALNNGTVALQAQVHDFQDLIQKSKQESITLLPPSIASTLKRAKHVVESLESLIFCIFTAAIGLFVCVR